MKRKKMRTYAPEFKQQAINLADEMGSIAGAAKKLGLNKATVYAWVTKAEGVVTKAPAVAGESPEQELARLRQENQDLKKANIILKSAAAFFSQDHLK
jgi:transposase